MSRTARFTQLALVLGIVVGAGGAATLGEAQGNLNARLRGTYAFTQSRTCTVAGLPFVGPTFAIPSFTFFFRQAASDSGVITFNGNGTGTTTGRSSTMNITAGPGPGILSVSEFTRDFNYAVDPDGTVDTAGVTVFQTVLGSGTGNTGTVTGGVGRLQIAHGNTMLVSAPQEQITDETVVINFPTPPGGSVTQHRLCVRSLTATKLPSP